MIKLDRSLGLRMRLHGSRFSHDQELPDSQVPNVSSAGKDVAASLVERCHFTMAIHVS